MYSSLPLKVHQKASAIGLKRAKDTFVMEFLKKTLPAKRLKSGELQDLEYSKQCLDNKPSKKTNVKVTKKKKALSSSERRKLKLMEIDKTGQRFETYLPMHNLWKDYIKQTLGLSDQKRIPHQKACCENMLKADFHGCFITVSKSRCPSYVGATGIVVMETKNTFKIITTENKVKCIPKRGSVFMFEIEGRYFTLYGNNFCLQPAMRSTYKFKPKKNIAI